MSYRKLLPNSVFAILILLFSCKKENNNNSSSSPVTGNYSSSYISNLLPLMGSCIDNTGKLLFYQLPLLDSATITHPVISAKILKATGINTYSTAFDFQSKFFGMGNYSGFTYNNQYGWIPDGICISMAITKNGNLYMSYNSANELYQVYINNYYAHYKIIDGITAITAFNNSIYAATSPIYDNSGNVVLQPRIYEIDSTGNQSLYYEFSSAISFNNYSGGMAGGNNTMYPLGFSISLKMDNDSSLYVAFGYNDIIYRLDKNKNLTRFVTDIPYPTAIDINNKGIMYVASAPTFSMDSLDNVTMNKPVRVYSISNGTEAKIYEGKLFTPVLGGGNTITDPLHRQTHAFYNLSVSSSNEIFLVSPVEGNVVRIN